MDFFRASNGVWASKISSKLCCIDCKTKTLMCVSNCGVWHKCTNNCKYCEQSDLMEYCFKRCKQNKGERHEDS